MRGRDRGKLRRALRQEAPKTYSASVRLDARERVFEETRKLRQKRRTCEGSVVSADGP